MIQEFIIAVHQCDDFSRRLKFNLPDTIIVLEKKKMIMLPQAIRMNPISCIILHLDQNIPDELYFERIKKIFPHIPWIAVLASRDMEQLELARHCGVMGIDCVLSYDDIDLIEDKIAKVCAFKSNRVSLVDINIMKESANYSTMLQEALSIIERHYTKILNTIEISDLMELAESTLSREFVKFGLPGPKNILIRMKVQNSINLMRNKGLNIREISSLSGFTDEKRMAECFHRMFGMPPGEYRLKNNITQFTITK